jgi:uncharacterized membrane protein YkoI
MVMRSTVNGLLLAAVLGVAPAAWADEEKVPLDKVPKSVMETVKKRFPDGAVSGASKEDENGKTVYEVTLKNKGQNIDITVAPDGSLVSIESEIPARDLPRAVTEAIEAKYPRAAYKKAETIVKVKDGKEAPPYYEALIQTADKKAIELEVSAEGKIMNEENKDKEKDKDKN